MLSFNIEAETEAKYHVQQNVLVLFLMVVVFLTCWHTNHTEKGPLTMGHVPRFHVPNVSCMLSKSQVKRSVFSTLETPGSSVKLPASRIQTFKLSSSIKSTKNLTVWSCKTRAEHARIDSGLMGWYGLIGWWGVAEIIWVPSAFDMERIGRIESKREEVKLASIP